MTDSELIRSVAENVMGWKLKQINIPASVVTDEWFYEDNNGKFLRFTKDWNPLTNANHWGMVVERMRERGWRLRIDDYGVYYLVTFLYPDSKNKTYACAIAEARHQDLGHAVCEAALKAVA